MTRTCKNCEYCAITKWWDSFERVNPEYEAAWDEAQRRWEDELTWLGKKIFTPDYFMKTPVIIHEPYERESYECQKRAKREDVYASFSCGEFKQKDEEE